MAREKWLINPAELDDFQRDIRGLALDKSYAIKGCAGSGKTILALYRALDIQIDAMAEDENAPASFTFVVFTKALVGFIRSGIIELNIPIKQIIHYEKWDGGEVDHVIVDEAQDFTKDEIDIFDSAKIKSIMLYGDTNQQIYGTIKNNEVLSIEQIATHLKIPKKELLNNYRLPKNVATFATHLTTDNKLEERCVKLFGDKPRLIKFDSWQSELDFIIEEIKVRNYTDVAILVPFNIIKKATRNNGHRNVQSIKQYFEKIGFRHEYKMREEESDSLNLDFDSDNPKVLTFHSSKGLQFETIFIPFCDYPHHDDWFKTRFQNPLYVAITRTYKNLYVTHSDRLSPFINEISPTSYT